MELPCVVDNQLDKFVPESGAHDYFLRLLRGTTGFFVGRIGGTDWDLASYYFSKVFLEAVSKEEILSDLAFLGRLQTAREWNGYYDLRDDPRNAARFCDRLLQLYGTFDFCTVGHGKLLSALGFLRPGEWGYDHEEDAEYRTSLVGTVVRCGLSNYRYVEDMHAFFSEVFPALAGLKVLVCSPFDGSIRRQFARRHDLFTNHPNKSFVYPDFELLTLKTPVTYDGANEFPHADWFETSASLCREVSGLDFDVALLGCGTYAMELGAFIRSLGKGAIYMGGALQLYFGITGRRWRDLRHYTSLMNDCWITPIERPDVRVGDGSKTESFGAYW